MPDDRPIAESYVTIRPSTTGFKKETEQKLKAALAGEGIQVNVGADTTKAEKDIDAAKARAGKGKATIDVDADTTAAERGIDEVAAKADGLDATIDVDADTAAAEAKLDELERRKDAAAGDVAVDVDVDTAEAEADLDKVDAELDRVGAKTATAKVKVDGAAEAVAETQAAEAEVDKFGRKTATAKLKVDSSSAFGTLTSLAGVMAPLLSPFGASAAGGLLALSGGLTTAVTGFGGLAAVAVPSINKVKDALKAEEAASSSTAQSTAQDAQKQAQAAQDVADAKTALEQTERHADEASIDSAERVANARQALTDAQVSGARQVTQAQQQVSDAQEQAARDQETSLRQVATAEQALTSAQQAAKQAQDAITQARKDAAASLVDLSNQFADAQLAQRQDVLNLQDATTELKKTQADPRASQQERAQAQLNYDQAQQRLKEQQLTVQRLSDQKKAADKAGVDGSQQVLAAQDQLASANATVADREQDLAQVRRQAAQQAQDDAKAIAKAQDNAAYAQQQAAESVAKAQQQVSDAMRSQASQQADNAYSIAQAQERVQAAYTAAAQTAKDAGGAGTDAAKNLAAAMAALTPSEKNLLSAWKTFKSEYTDWAKSLEPNVVPVLTRGLGVLKDGMHDITPVVAGASDALSDLETDAQNALTGPWWHQFFDYLGNRAYGDVHAFGTVIGDLGTGFAGLIQASGPLQDKLETALEGVADKFKNFGQGARTDSSFLGFMSYVEDEAPKIGQLLHNFGQTFLDVSKDIAPVADAELQVINKTLELVDDIATAHPKLLELAAGFTAVYSASKLIKLTSIIGFVDKMAGLGGKAASGLSGIAGDVETLGVKAGISAAGTKAFNTGVEKAGTKLPGFKSALSGIGSLLGVIGGGSALAGAGVAALAVGVGIVGYKLATTTAWVDKYAQSQQKAFGAFGNNLSNYQAWNKTVSDGLPAQQQLVKTLTEQYKAAVNNGTVTNDMVQNLQKQQAALKGMEESSKSSNTQLSELTKNAKTVSDQFGISQQDALKLADSLGIDLSQSLDKTNKDGQKASDILKAYQQEVQDSHNPVKQLQEDLRIAGDNASTAADQVSGFQDALRLMSGQALDTSQAADDVQEGFENLSQAVQDNGTVLTGNSLAAIHNRDTIRQLGQQIIQHAESVQEQTGDVHQAEKTFDAETTALKNNLIQHGYDKKSVDDLLTSVGLIPGQWNDADSAVKNATGDMQTAIDDIKDRTIHITASGDWTESGDLNQLSRLKGGPVYTFAEGGLARGPGGPKGDRIPAMLSDHEYVNTASTVHREGVGAFDALNQGKATIVPRFAEGGLVNADFKFQPNGIFDKASDYAARAAAALGDNLAAAFAESMVTYDPGKGVDQWKNAVVKVLSQLHQSAALAGPVLSLIQHESGGDPNAVNRWDSNWAKGTPSVGLAQVIGPTFAAYAGPYKTTGPFAYGVSENPLANVYAGLNYGLHRYGSIAGIPGIASLIAGGTYKPYSTGGHPSIGQWFMAGEDGPEIIRMNTVPRVSSAAQSRTELAGQGIDYDALATAVERAVRAGLSGAQATISAAGARMIVTFLSDVQRRNERVR